MVNDPSPLFSVRRLLPLAMLVLAGALFAAFGGLRYVSFAALAEHRAWLCAAAASGGAAAVIGFILAYAALTAMSVPGAALFTVTGGFLFGTWFGAAYAVIGATLGATVVFLAARLGLAGLLARAGPRIRRLEAGFRDNALSYLLVLRLVPVFPFWAVNLAAGAVGLPLPLYVAATFVGMIPVTFIYASLGSGIGAVIAEGPPTALAILIRPKVLLPILALAALALLPVGYKIWRARRLKQPACTGSDEPVPMSPPR